MPGKVIVVEDDAAFCYAVSKALERAGYEVEPHVRSTEAWPFIGTTATVDLLLTDLTFPRGQPNGIALARNARLHHPRLAVIYMTAHPDAADHAKVEGGFVFQKPVELDALILKVGELLAANAVEVA
jgi:DNA-binding NtrC family response regulator